MPKRPLKAREPVSLAPAFVSQLTSLAVLGIDERRFRETFGKHPSAARVGKLVVVSVDVARDVLCAKATELPTDSEPDDDEPRDVDDVLARLGRRRAG